MKFKVLFQLRSIDFLMYGSHQFKTLLIKRPQNENYYPSVIDAGNNLGVEYGNNILHTLLRASQTLTIGNAFYL